MSYVEDPLKCGRQLCTERYYCQARAATPDMGGCVAFEGDCRACDCVTLQPGCTCDDSAPLVRVTCAG